MKNPYESVKNILQSVSDESLSETQTGAFTSIDLYGNAVHQKEGKKFHLENETGTGEVSLYRVFPGIELAYNDMHMAY